MSNKSKLLSYIAVIFLWLSLFQAGVFAASSIRINELMYNPSGNGDREFIEFYNGDNVSVDMSGWYVVGVAYTLPSGSVLPPKSYGVIVRNYAVFAPSNPGVRIFGQYPGKLKSGGELVRVVDSSQNIVSQVSFQSGGAWPTQPNDNGPSLSLIRNNANETLAACWAPSAGANGTPGSANSLNGAWVAANSGGCSNTAFATTNTSSGGSTGGNSNNEGGSNNSSDGSPDSNDSNDNSDESKNQQKKKKDQNEQEQSSRETDQQQNEQGEPVTVGISNDSNTGAKIIALLALLGLGTIAMYGSAIKRKASHKKRKGGHAKPSTVK